MTLRIESINLRNIRNYDDAVIEDLGDITVFVGENAVGKTNLIEAVQLLTALSSFRHSTIDQLIRHGEENGRAFARVTDDNRLLDIELLLEGRTRKYRLNGKAKRPLDLKGLIPSVIFTPDDLNLVKGPNGGRRAALDALGSQVNKSYYTVRRDYEKVIRHKNRLLKDESDAALIEAIDEMIVTVGAQLTLYRIALFERLTPHFVEKYREISHGREKLGVVYVPSWEQEEGKDVAFRESSDSPSSLSPSVARPSSVSRDDARMLLSRALHERAGEERRRGRALVGPHSDKIVFSLDGKDASVYGSQGQQRSIVLAYKLAEAAVVEEILEQKPVLLLDDVMSELDESRRHALVTAMEGGSQTFITTANIDYFDAAMLEKSKIIKLPFS